MQSLKRSSKKPLSFSAATVIEDFRTAEDILSMKEQRDQPVRLIEKAIKALQNSDKTDKHFRETRVKNAMDRLYGIIQEIKKDLET